MNSPNKGLLKIIQMIINPIKDENLFIIEKYGN